MNYRTLTALSELCILITDGKHGDCQDEVDSGYFFLSAKDVRNGKLNYEDARQITRADFLETHKRTQLEPYDILLSNSGTIGRLAIAPDDPRTYQTTFQKSVAILKVEKSIVDPRWLFYVLTSERQTLTELAGGSVQKNLLLRDLRNFKVVVPPLEEQREIANILGSLDDKIKANRRMNETLEATARAIFKSWFVDFDPVHVKARGETPSGMDAETAALFPDSFEDSELGPIPSGWRVGTLGEVAENPRRSINPQNISGGTPYIGLEHMPQRSIALGEWGTGDDVESNKYSFHRGEFLFGKLRPYFHKVGIAPVDGICSTDILVTVPQSEGWAGFVLFHISSDEFVNYTNTTSTGTKMPRTNWHDMSAYGVVLPFEALASYFSELVFPMMQSIIENVHQSRSLAETRDTLLPKLVSGEVRVPLMESS